MRAFLVFAIFGLLGCSGARPAEEKPAPIEEKKTQSCETPLSDGPLLELVESWPIETSLGNDDLPDTQAVWLELIRCAQVSIDFEHFYAAAAPEGVEGALEEVLVAIEEASARGVKVRFIVDKKLLKYNEVVPKRLEKIENLSLRIFDVSESMGGVQHSKFMVVDGHTAFFGSQNFDWRSLSHIQELGVRTKVPEVVENLAGIFNYDWALAGGEEAPDAKPTLTQSTIEYEGEETTLSFGASPKGYLLDDAQWDLPQLLGAIESAKKSLRVQILNYSNVNYDGSSFLELEEALFAAADRGVKVKVIVSDWNKKARTVDSVKGLAKHENLEVRFVTIPEWSEGFVDHSRVVHSKFLAVDGERGWVGTSNWSGDYFTQSRNVGLFVEGQRFAQRLEALHEQLWQSEYAYPVDPEVDYEPPRIKE